MTPCRSTARNALIYAKQAPNSHRAGRGAFFSPPFNNITRPLKGFPAASTLPYGKIMRKSYTGRRPLQFVTDFYFPEKPFPLNGGIFFS
jgi:hypothetical protein